MISKYDTQLETFTLWGFSKGSSPLLPPNTAACATPFGGYMWKITLRGNYQAGSSKSPNAKDQEPYTICRDPAHKP